MKSRTINFIVWPIRVLLAAGFLLAGISKVTGNPAIFEMFQSWGYSAWFCYLIGGMELLGALLLVIPKTTYYASVVLFLIMIGALITHVIHDPLAQVIRPGIFMLLLGANIYFGKKI